MATKKTLSPLETMGERLQQLQKNTGLTQADLAKKIGISHTQMARYEIKNIYPPADVLKELAEVFGITIYYLVMGTQKTKPRHR